MSRSLRWLVRGLAAATGALGLALAAGYVAAARGAPVVPRTVVDDPALPRVTVRGVRLHVRTFGDPSRPVVIVIHGGPGNDSRYLLPLATLADRYRVVFYDQRGSGLSERVPDARLRLEDFYDELDGIVDRYSGGHPVRLVGHSWGAMLASGYLGRHPEKVARVVLAEPGMLTSETARRLMDATNGMRPPATLGAALAMTRAWLAALHVRGPDPDARRDAFAAALLGADVPGHPMARYGCDGHPPAIAGWRFGARVAPALLGEARRRDGSWDVDFVRGVERWEGKVLLLAGGCDTVPGAQQPRHLRLFRNAELVVVPGAGHLMFTDRPAESLAVVRRYLE